MVVRLLGVAAGTDHDDEDEDDGDDGGRDEADEVDLAAAGVDPAAGEGVLLAPEAKGARDGDEDGQQVADAGERLADAVEAKVGVVDDGVVEREELRDEHADHGKRQRGAHVRQVRPLEGYPLVSIYLDLYIDSYRQRENTEVVAVLLSGDADGDVRPPEALQAGKGPAGLSAGRRQDALGGRAARGDDAQLARGHRDGRARP